MTAKKVAAPRYTAAQLREQLLQAENVQAATAIRTKARKVTSAKNAVATAQAEVDTAKVALDTAQKVFDQAKVNLEKALAAQVVVQQDASVSSATPTNNPLSATPLVVKKDKSFLDGLRGR